MNSWRPAVTVVNFPFPLAATITERVLTVCGLVQVALLVALVVSTYRFVICDPAWRRDQAQCRATFAGGKPADFVTKAVRDT